MLDLITTEGRQVFRLFTLNGEAAAQAAVSRMVEMVLLLARPRRHLPF